MVTKQNVITTSAVSKTISENVCETNGSIARQLHRQTIPRPKLSRSRLDQIQAFITVVCVPGSSETCRFKKPLGLTKSPKPDKPTKFYKWIDSPFPIAIRPSTGGSQSSATQNSLFLRSTNEHLTRDTSTARERALTRQILQTRFQVLDHFSLRVLAVELVFELLIVRVCQLIRFGNS